MPLRQQCAQSRPRAAWLRVFYARRQKTKTENIPPRPIKRIRGRLWAAWLRDVDYWEIDEWKLRVERIPALATTYCENTRFCIRSCPRSLRVRSTLKKKIQCDFEKKYRLCLRVPAHDRTRQTDGPVTAHVKDARLKRDYEATTEAAIDIIIGWFVICLKRDVSIGWHFRLFVVTRCCFALLDPVHRTQNR